MGLTKGNRSIERARSSLPFIKGALILIFSGQCQRIHYLPIYRVNCIVFKPALITQPPNMSRLILLAIMVMPSTMAFPWMADMPGVKSASEIEAQHAKRQATCPFNADHVPAAPITSEFPYAGAQNGLPSIFPGNFQVPANGDTAHAFVAPGPNDIRGPCPGLNTAANHNVRLQAPSAAWYIR